MAFMSYLGLAAMGYSMFKGQQAAGEQKDIANAQAASTRETAAHNADVSRYDAAVSRQDALTLETATGWEVKQFLEKAGQLIGAQKTTYAKAGVALTGSAKTVIDKTVRDAGRQAEIIRFNGLTAAAAKESLAKRYDKLAQYGLRDAASQAYQIELAGAAQASATSTKSLTDGMMGIYSIGSEAGWFD